MASCNCGKSYTNNSCEPFRDPCKPERVNTSNIFYDGPDLAALCIKRGMDLNTVLRIMNDFALRMMESQEEIVTDVFNNGIEVSLSQIPFSVNIVTYCGSIVPANGYIVNGRIVKLNDKLFCYESGNEITVTYQAMIDTSKC